MRKPSATQNYPLPTDGRPELCLLVDGKIFGMSFLTLESARRAAHYLNATDREVDVFERQSGRVIERIRIGSTDTDGEQGKPLRAKAG